MISRYRIPLPPPITNSSSPEFAVSVEEYVRRIRDAYDKRANGHRRYYRISGIVVIVGGASLPLLTTANYADKNLVISLVGVLVSAVTALRAFYRWDHMWALLRATEFAVSRAYWEWRGVVDGNLNAADNAASREATTRLLERISDIRRDEALSFFKDLPFPQKG